MQQFAKPWQTEHHPNLTGTSNQYYPRGYLLSQDWGVKPARFLGNIKPADFKQIPGEVSKEALEQLTTETPKSIEQKKV